MSKKKSTRPAFVQPCTSTEDHSKHPWRFSEEWPEGVFWHCRGYNKAEAVQGAINTQRAIRNIQKRTKEGRARARRARKNLPNA